MSTPISLDGLGPPTPRDGDGDGLIEDGTPRERPLPHRADSFDHYAHEDDAPGGFLGPQEPGPRGLREFGDADAIRGRIYDNVFSAAQAIKPATNPRHTLRISRLEYDGPGEFSLAEQKAAILEGRTLGRKLRGDYELVDNETGAVVDRKRTTVALVPYISPRGTFIHNGNEYTLASQLRLRPGVYSRRKGNGELEAHVNVMPGHGPGSRVFLEPETQKFRIKIGQALLPLASVLRALGVRDEELRREWGNELAQANLRDDDTAAVRKLHARLVRDDPESAADPASMRAAVAAAFEAMPLDPEVTRKTLGAPYANVGRDTLMATARKLIALNRGEVEPDDRDHLAYMTLLGPEDLIAERLGRTRMAMGAALWKASRTGNVSRVAPGMLTRSVAAALVSSGLGQPLESTNPGSIYDQQLRVTRMGEGGISSDAVPLESRDVQPSHLGFIDLIVTPESGAVGVDSRVARAVRKGSDGRMYAPFVDVRTGKRAWKSPQDLDGKVVAFPGEMRNGRPFVNTLVDGKLRVVTRDKVDYELSVFEDAFTPVANMVPMKSAVKGQRVSMGARFLAQALPLAGAESPLVQSGIPGSKDDSYENLYGARFGALRSDVAGVVTAAGPGLVSVRGADGRRRDFELYDNFAFNRKTGIHQVPVVRPGDRVSPGQLLARSNYTDADGVTALGKNLRVAYIAHDGHNFEDAISISESAAKKLTSEHFYQHFKGAEDGLVAGKGRFTGLFAAKFDGRQLAAVDDDGAVKKGTVVRYGDPLVLAVKERPKVHSSLSKGRSHAYADASETWEHHADGLVTDVAKTKDGINVVVKTHVPMKVGDKLSGRYGDKGVISRIVPDHEMPHDKDGNPVEVALNPLGIVTRTNPAQMVEAALGKVAAVTGKPYRVQDFHEVEDLTEFAEGELRRHGMVDREDLVDPSTGRTIPRIFTGNRFLMKLHHMSEDKGLGRGTGSYTAEGSPAKGGESGSKRVALSDLNALLSHGAHAVVVDAGVVTGQQNEDYWQQFMAGHAPPLPEVPLVYQKFVNSLRAAGINPVRSGTKTHVMALTDGDVDELAGDRELENAEVVDWKGGLKPVKGGLFDEALTGGHLGTKWAKITLAEPMPSPVMEDPIRRVLGLTEAKFRDVLAGRETLEGRTGPAAIAHALGRIDVDKAVERARLEIASGRRTARDVAVRRLGYLKAAQRLGLHPRDWVLTRAPVLPPVFRPVSSMAGSGIPIVADPNLLYRELFDANVNLKEMSGRVGDLGDERLALYDAFKGVVGLGDPLTPRNRERQVRGVLRHVFGGSSKFGMVQRKLLSSTVDLVGRAVITPDPELDMDQVGIPEDRAWAVYRPFVVRALVREGVPRLRAVRAVEGREAMARDALVGEMSRRPVVVNRAPVLHKYGRMGFFPVLAKGSTLRVSPLIVKGFGADFDGDMENYYVPGTDEAARDVAEKMLPSRNLLSASTFRVHELPQNEYLGGLTVATAKHEGSKKAPMTFATRRDAIRAWHRGEVDVDTPVAIVEP